MLALFDNQRVRVALWSVLVVVAALVPVVAERPYYVHLATITLIWVVLAQGLNLIQGITGYISLAQATFMGIGGYVSAIVATQFDMPVSLSMLLGVLAAALVGFLLSIPALRTRGHYFAITTMALSVVTSLIMRNWRGVTGGAEGFGGIPRPALTIGPLDLSTREGYLYVALLLAVLTTVFVARLRASRYGRALIAIRESEQLAWAVGINILGFKRLAFTLSALLGGIAGAMFVHAINFINPGPFHLARSLDAILAVIVGGSGTILGPVLGAVLVVFVPEYLRVADEFRLVTYGIMFIVIVMFLPRGLVGWLVHRIDEARAERTEAQRRGDPQQPKEVTPT